MIDVEGLVLVWRVVSFEGEIFIVYYLEGDGFVDNMLLCLLFEYLWLFGVVFLVVGVVLVFGLMVVWIWLIVGL